MIPKILLTMSIAGWNLAFAALIPVLIVDGQNNHDFRATTPHLKSILEETGLFSVEVATTPGKGGDMSAFKPQFSQYRVVVSNYNGESWSSETRDAFVRFVRDGGGFVSVHAADNSFPTWLEYNQMIGVGGWEGRNQDSGPYLRFRDGRWVHDKSAGVGGSHGRQHEFVVETRAPDHPIMSGLPKRWLHAKDELYDRLRGPAENATVLASAFSTKESGGSGEHEPLLMTIEFGKGRVFHTALGHNNGKDITSQRCIGFITTFQRGVEWAATGKVTQKVPADFPTEDKVRVRTASAAKSLIRIAAIQPKARLIDWRLSDPEKVLSAVEQSITELEDLIEKAAAERCTAVALPEDTLGLGNWLAGNEELARDVLPLAVERMLERFGKVAARHSIYLVCCNDHALPDGTIYNTAFLIGPDGKQIGHYRKVCPTIHESARARGSEFPVFPTAELGGVGMLICYDMVFPETARALALGGADIIFHPTLGGAAIGDGDISRAAFRTRAVENFVYLVVAQRGNGSMIISPKGKIIAEAKGQDSMAIAEIDPFGGRDGGDAMNHQHDMRARLFRERNPAAFSILTDPNPPVLSKLPESISSTEAREIAGKVLTIGQEEFNAADALARKGQTAEARAAYERLRKEYRGSWIDRVSTERLAKLGEAPSTDKN